MMSVSARVQTGFSEWFDDNGEGEKIGGGGDGE